MTITTDPDMGYKRPLYLIFEKENGERAIVGNDRLIYVYANDKSSLSEIQREAQWAAEQGILKRNPDLRLVGFSYGPTSAEILF